VKKIVIEQLRERSRVRGKEKTWVYELSDDQLYELFLRLRNGENSKSIARHIQDAWGINPESSAHSLGQGIGKFKRRIAHLLITPTMDEGNSCPTPFTCPSEDTLESLEQIANLHRARIKAMLEEEERTGVRYPHLNRDLQALSTLQKLIIKQKVFEKFHDDPVKQRRMAGLEKEVGERWGALMDEWGEEGRMKMVTAIDRFLELAKEHSVPTEIGPDGKLRLVESKK
jgi:hypothetical protein